MTRFSGKLLMACLLIGFGIFFGVEIAKNGIEHVNGPFVQDGTEDKRHTIKHIEKEQPIINNVQVVDQPEDKAVDHTLRPATANKAIHRIANKTEHVLESSLQGGVEIIVSLFEVMVH